MLALVLPSFARSCIAMKFGIAIAARMPMITTTIISSISVKPFCDLLMMRSPPAAAGTPGDASAPSVTFRLLTGREHQCNGCALAIALDVVARLGAGVVGVARDPRCRRRRGG